MKISPAQLAALSAQANAQRTAAQAQSQGQAERARAPQPPTTGPQGKVAPRTGQRPDVAESFVPIRAPDLAKPQAKAPSAPNRENIAVPASAPAAAPAASKGVGLDRAAIIAAAYGRPAEAARAQNIPAAWREAPMAGTRPAYVPPGSQLNIKV